VLVAERWRETGDVSDIQRYALIGAASEAYTNYQFSDKSISDASFLRVKTVSLSYQFPSPLKQMPWMQQCKIYAQAQNLFTITNYVGLDPESQSSVTLPPLRMITFGFQLTL